MSNSLQHAFPKQERLCSQKLIDHLFDQGHRLMFFPYSVRWMTCPSEALPDGVRVQILIATSKKKFRHAVDRNRVKRLTRECYRRQKSTLVDDLETTGLALLLAVNYVHRDIFSYEVLYGKMERIIATLGKEIRGKSIPNPPNE